ncbi:LPS assembly lipoprotein LptE [Salinicola aestuarinus]|uniref:LPS-assembly lipoprotein LptE n=1 Tax=Salinicola aestuarinus TaxID=1949082 RepID=UPI000DA198DA|nr:LPS assembly lipoprotein LptE [Salinicola aestuarinus]
MTRRPVLIGLMAIALTTLAGCGFQLRGLNQPVLGLSEVALSTNVSPFSETVRRAIERTDTEIVDSADLRINLGDERISETRLTLADSGSRETRLVLTAPYSVQRTSDGAYLLNQEQLDVSTNTLISTDDIYSRDELRDEAIQRLRRDAAEQLITRLATLETP